MRWGVRLSRGQFRIKLPTSWDELSERECLQVAKVVMRLADEPKEGPLSITERSALLLVLKRLIRPNLLLRPVVTYWIWRLELAERRNKESKEEQADRVTLQMEVLNVCVNSLIWCLPNRTGFKIHSKNWLLKSVSTGFWPWQKVESPCLRIVDLTYGHWIDIEDNLALIGDVERPQQAEKSLLHIYQNAGGYKPRKPAQSLKKGVQIKPEAIYLVILNYEGFKLSLTNHNPNVFNGPERKPGAKAVKVANWHEFSAVMAGTNSELNAMLENNLWQVLKVLDKRLEAA